MPQPVVCSRRQFIAGLGSLAAASALGADGGPGVERIIDIHQHTNYSGRTDDQLIAHQRAMGVTTTILLPAGKYYGLDAQCGGNDTCQRLKDRLPGEYLQFANEIPYLADATENITRFLRAGAIGIGEQKFRVLSDSTYLHKLADIAQEFDVPVLLHFWDGDYNMEFARFHKTLEKYPEVNFIGHAQTWWGNIDKDYQQGVMYPAGKVTPGGITDRLLADYPNMYGDMSAGSGLRAILRDEDHYRGFMERHQDKLLFGSDCNDAIGRGPGCQGAQTIAAIRRVASTKAVERKVLFENANRLFKLKL